MRVVGKRKMRGLSLFPSGMLLKQGAVFNDDLHQLPTGDTTYFPKGVYRYKSFEEAEAHFMKYVIKGMATSVINRAMSNGKNDRK